MIDYTEELFNAIKTISKKEIEALHFDTTIEVTITDASRAHLGIYTVTNGSIYFTAYSKDTYKEKDRVLVMIPQGDYDQQKIIIGKKARGDADKPINYTEPFSQIIDITNNLVPKGIAEFGMVANGGDYKWENNDTSSFTTTSSIKSTFIWSARKYSSSEQPEQEDTFKEEKGLTRVGLKADFKTLLKQFNTISGNYGLVLCVGFRNPDEQLPEDSILQSTIIQPFVFDSKDFFGNIYNFNAYYTQEAVFDISQYSNLILSDIFLFAYQKGNFRDINNNLISYEDRPDNIFINNYYICLGKDISEFNGDSLELYSFNETIFNKDNNTKEINLRWIHQDENSNIVKALNDNEIEGLTNYEVRWYKYKLGAPSPDSFMGAHWELINFSEDTDKTTYQLTADIAKEFERIQATVIKDGVQLITRSNILEFTNEKEVINNSLVKDINALSIRYDDDRHGNYFVYDSMQNVLNNEDTIVRKLTAVFADNVDNVYAKSILQDCESIKWIFPDSNSMIVPLDFNQDIIQFNNENQEQISINNDFWILHINGNYIIGKDNLNGVADISKYTSIYYKINKNLNFNFGRNTIYLEVIKNGQIYIASITMQFNIAGTSGSEYTLDINWDNQKNTFDVSKADEELSGYITLLDLQHSEVELNSEANYEYNWYKFNGETEHLKISHSGDNNSHFSISKEDGLNINELYILEVKLINFGNYELITRITVPLTQLYYDNSNQQIFKAGQIEGPKLVRYATDGLLAAFDKTPYNISLQKKNNQNQWENIKDTFDVGYWKITPEETSMAYLTQNSSATIDNIINFFIENNNDNNDYLRLLYRLIRKTTTIDSEQNFQLLNLEELVVEDVLNALNSTDQDQKNNEDFLFFQDDAGYQNLLSIIDNYKKCFNNNNKYFLLLKLLQEIAFDSQLDTDINLSDILTLKNWENFLKDSQLLPATFYKNNTGLYGVQYVYNEEITINGSKIKNRVLWTQPIYVYRDIYPSPTLNQWDGKLTIDKDNNTILVQGMSAGRKEEDNTFSGVMFGDWTKDSVATPLTGIYGFNHGQMTYALQDNGSAFFGNDNGKIFINSQDQNNKNSINLLVEENNNRVEIKPGALIIQTREKTTDPYNSLLEINQINGKNIYLLQSQNFSDEQQTGMKIDLQNGEIKGYNFSLLSQTNQNNMRYSLELSSGQNDLSFVKITRERTTSAMIKMPDSETARTNSALLDETIKNANEQIDKIYNAFILMISLFYKLAKLDNSLYSQKIQEIYMKIINFPDNELSTVTELLNYIISQEELNNSKILNDSGVLKDNWQQDWTFDELSNIFLFLLNQNQIEAIKDKFNFDININEDFIKNRNLFFPKIPNYKLNDGNYNDILYDNEISRYNNLIRGITTNPQIENINTTNSMAKELIETYELNSLHYSLKKASDNNYYINIEDGALRHLKDIRTMNINPIPEGYYIIDYEKDTNSHQSEAVESCYPKAKFTQIETIEDNGKGDLYKLSIIVDKGHKVFIRYAVKKGDDGFSTDDYRGGKKCIALNVVTHNNTAVDLFFGKKEVMRILKDNGDVDARYDIEKQAGTIFQLGVKIKNSNELIGKQKIRAKIQETLNEYSTALNLCQSIIDRNNWISDSQAKKDKHIWNFYYNKIETSINTIRNSSQDNIYLNQFPNILIPLDFSFRKELIITNNNLTDFHINDNGIIRTCNKNDFISINNNLYSLLDTKQYYVYLYNNDLDTGQIKSYLYIYDTYDGYSHNDTTGQNYKQINYYMLSDLGMTVLKKCEDIEQQEKFYQNSLLNDNTTTYVDEKLWIFDQRNWDNDLININKNGGYITSKNYRPTMLENDKSVKKPTDYFGVSPGIYSQGLKGFVLDFTNDRFVLGNNASIQGYQSQYYPGQTSVSCREFTISTGANFITQDDRDKVSNTTYFIQAKSGLTPSQVQNIFTVDWTGVISCRGIKGLTNSTLEVQDNLSVKNGCFYFGGKEVTTQGYDSDGYPRNSGDTRIVGHWLIVK